MKSFFSFLLIIVLPFQLLYAKNVDIKTARTVALNSYGEKYQNYYKLAKKTAVSITNDFTITNNGNVAYYVFNTSNNGFIIVSANDIITPILGYSFQSDYSEDNQPPQFKSWMNSYAMQISNAISAKQTASVETTNEWKRLSANYENFNSVKGITDIPVLLTTTWNQDCYYNAMCPSDASATNSCGYAYAGCVATAMGQVMNYYKYPLQGQGSHSYSSSYGNLSANFASTTYDWNAMPNHLNTTNAAVATLLYHCGVSVDMNYSAEGSGAYMYDAANSLETYFKYSNVQYGSKSSYTDTNWENLLKNELDNKRPMMYSGHDPSSGEGHAWVCDGYQGTNYFHFNWGWGGYYDGFFYLDNLNPGSNNLTSTQSCIYNIIPGTDYPYYCSSSKSLTASSGTFNDGSGPLNDYQNNSDCNWLISPDLVKYITLNFDYLNTEDSNDIITIYDGSDASAPVLGTFSGTTLPSSISSTGPSVFVNFTSNNVNVSPGWQISYSSTPLVFCSGTSLLTAASDTFSDGSGESTYGNSSNCKWRIEPPNATSVTVTFSSFNTEASKDLVKIYDPTGTSTLLATYSGSSVPSSVTSTSGKMLLIFTSNASTTASGWNASYTSAPYGISETADMKEILVYPNPATSEVNISLDLNAAQNPGIEIINSLGQTVYAKTTDNITGSVIKKINTENFQKGIYTIRLVSGNDSYCKKLIIE